MLLLKGRSIAVLMIQKLIDSCVIALDVFAFTFFRFSYVFYLPWTPSLSERRRWYLWILRSWYIFIALMSDGCVILFLPELQKKKVQSRILPRSCQKASFKGPSFNLDPLLRYSIPRLQEFLHVWIEIARNLKEVPILWTIYHWIRQSATLPKPQLLSLGVAMCQIEREPLLGGVLRE